MVGPTTCTFLLIVCLGLLRGLAAEGSPSQLEPPFLRQTAQEREGPYLVRVYLQDYLKELEELNSEGFDIAGVEFGYSADLILDGAGLAAIVDRGIKHQIIDTAGLRGGLDARYFSPERIADALANYEALYPNLFRRIPIGVSGEGRTIWAGKISNNVSEDQDKPTILFDANHHAREIMTMEVVMDIIDYLLSNYDNLATPWVRTWVDTLNIWTVPMLNVDGNSYVWSGCRWQRKNKRACGLPEGCFEGNGTDLNRNYDFHWGGAVCQGSSSQCAAEDFRGTAPWNEESAALRDLALQIRPVFNISFHSFSQLVILPYGCDASAEDAALRNVALGIGQLIPRDEGGQGYTVGRSPEVLYPTDGTSIDWLYGRLGVFAYVIELNGGQEGFQPPYDPWRDFTIQALRPIEGDRRGGWMYVLDRVSTGGSVWGHTRDAATGDPIAEVQIDIQEIIFTQGEFPRLTNQFGRYQWILRPGTYTVRFSKAGFVPQTRVVNVSNDPIQLDIDLAAQTNRD